MTTGLLDTLASWAEAGWLRRLDAAFAAFIAELDPAAPEPLLLAAALLAQLEGRGHGCLDLADWPQGAAVLGLAPELLRELRRRAPAAWRDALRGSPVVEEIGAARQPAAAPLVLDGDRLYLRRYRDFELRVAAQIAARSTVSEPPAAAPLRRWLDRLFPESNSDEPNWQKIACAVALRADFSVITGGPGTGKTYTAARLLALLFACAPRPLRVALAAPTGKAAARLKQSIDAALLALVAQLGGDAPPDLAARIPAARTLHALLGARPGTRKLRHHAANPLDVDVLIVDEASMVHLEMMADLLDALPPRARVILLGDKDQLASVEAGAVLGELCAQAARGGYRDPAWIGAAAGVAPGPELCDPAGTDLQQQVVMLRHSWRFGDAIGRLALAVNQGEAAAAAQLLEAGGALRWVNPAQPEQVTALALQGWADYLEALRAGAAAERVLEAFDAFRVLCALREGPWGVDATNLAIAAALTRHGVLRADAEWYAGRPVMVTRNDHDLGVYNGDIGIALRGASGLRVHFAGSAGTRSVSVSRLAQVETAFALTVHKSQGSEFAHTALLLPEGGASRELIYTGLTRARTAFTLFTPDARALPDGIARVTRRGSGLLARTK
jgi:exodeoxyribonuclease V alpha subunit